ncbi:MAG: prenyltransferase, partial [Phycisphaerae bacterium]
VKRSDPALKGAAERILGSLREDGRFRPAPKGAVYPCHTASAASVLGRLGYAADRRLKRTFDHLFEVQHDDGGWRCNRVKLRRSPTTDASNPGVTLGVLDAFRFTPFLNEDRRLDKAVRSLLDHWKTRKPLGPCGFGIGTLFMQVEYPFLRYNLFYYVYVLSFYNAAKKAAAFQAALQALESKLVDGKIVVENPNRKLAQFSFCKKGQPSALATRRYRELLKNLGN